MIHSASTSLFSCKKPKRYLPNTFPIIPTSYYVTIFNVINSIVNFTYILQYLSILRSVTYSGALISHIRSAEFL